MSVAGPTKGVTRLLTRDEFGWGTRCVRWYCAAASAARGNHLCFFSLSLLSSKRKRGEFWGRRRIFSLGFVQAFLPVVFVVFLFFFQRRVGETFRLHDDVSFFSTREQSVDDSGDSLQRRHDVSCVYRGSSFSSFSPSSRACTACGVFLKMILFVGQTSFMFWCIFFSIDEIIYSFFCEKSRVISVSAPKKKIIDHHQSFYHRHHPIHDDGIKTQKVFTHFSFFTFVCVEIQTHTRVLF